MAHWRSTCCFVDLGMSFCFDDWHHHLGIGFKPVCRLFGLFAKDGNGSIMHSIPEVLPSFTGVAVQFAWIDVLQRSYKLFHSVLVVCLAGVSSRPTFLFGVMQSPWLQLHVKLTLDCTKRLVRIRYNLTGTNN